MSEDGKINGAEFTPPHTPEQAQAVPAEARVHEQPRQYDPRHSIIYIHTQFLIEIAERAAALVATLTKNPQYEHTPSVQNKLESLREILEQVAPGSNPLLLASMERILGIAEPGIDFIAGGFAIIANTSEKKIVIRASILNGTKSVHIPLDKDGATNLEAGVAAALDKLFPERIISAAPPKLIV